MLSGDVDRYIGLRRTLGYKLRIPERHLRAFVSYATSRGEAHIRTATVLTWVAEAGQTQEARAERFRSLALFARFLHAEDPRHEILGRNPFVVRKTRPVPYIYTSDEIARILDAAGKLRHQRPNPLRRELYITIFGLIAATGLRISEAIALHVDDVWPDGVLYIRETKFCKSRLVPLHPTVVDALGRYLENRQRIAADCDYLFPSVRHRALCPSTVNDTFRSLLRRANVAPGRKRQPRVHDLRHNSEYPIIPSGCREGRESGGFLASLSALSEALQEGQEVIIPLVAAEAHLRRIRLRQGLFFEFQVGVQIDSGCFDNISGRRRAVLQIVHCSSP